MENKAVNDFYCAAGFAAYTIFMGFAAVANFAMQNYALGGLCAAGFLAGLEYTIDYSGSVIETLKAADANSKKLSL